MYLSKCTDTELKADDWIIEKEIGMRKSANVCETVLELTLNCCFLDAVDIYRISVTECFIWQKNVCLLSWSSHENVRKTSGADT
jgi:hypothetical protein